MLFSNTKKNGPCLFSFNVSLKQGQSLLIFMSCKQVNTNLLWRRCLFTENYFIIQILQPVEQFDTCFNCLHFLWTLFFLSNQIDEENQMLGEYRPAGWAQNVLHPTPTLYSPPLAKSPLFASVLSPFILRWQSSEKRHIFHSCWLKGTNIQCKKCSNNGNEIIITFYFFCRICVEPKLDQTRLVCM